MRADLARALAGAYLDGAWDEPGLFASGVQVLRRRPRWLCVLAEQVLEIYPTAPLDRPRELAAVIATRLAAERASGVRPMRQVVAPTRMLANPWHLPVLDDLAGLAELLDVSAPDLDWFADAKRLTRSTHTTALQHYRVSTRPAPSGAVRVLEAPKARLKTLQRRLLRGLLSNIPAHDAAHGFRIGRSVSTFTAPHAGQAVVVRMDLESFFASVTVGRVYGLWRTTGYPEPVAHALAGLTTAVLPHRAWTAVRRPADPDLLAAHWRLGRRLAAPHLPQGAPTSPALVNLAAFRLDVRLSALARSWGGRYTRYADDLALSGGRSWGRGTSQLVDLVTNIATQEGFRVNERKTWVQPRAGRQLLGGLVVNERPHVARVEVDLLRALLHNCLRYGPTSQNRSGVADFAAHLTGRVAWVAQHDPGRGDRLKASLARIDWTR